MHFHVIKDYRQAGKINHKLSDIILMTICGVLSGHDTWEGVVDFGCLRLDFLKQYGDFKEGIPSADTLGMMSTTALQNAFIKWREIATP